jgi:hypothetical protein
MHPVTHHITAHPTHPHQNRTDSSTQMAAHKQYITCLQPQKPLLIRWIVGRTMMPHCQDHWQRSGMVMGPNNNYVIWASDKFFFVCLMFLSNPSLISRIKDTANNENPQHMAHTQTPQALLQATAHRADR